MVEAVGFDLDHTLVDWGPYLTIETWVNEVGNRVLEEELGVTFPPDKWVKIYREEPPGWEKRIWDALFEEELKLRKRLLEKEIPKLYEDVILTLEELKEMGLLLFIVTDAGTKSALYITRELGIEDYFTEIRGKDYNKPKSDTISDVLKKYNIEPRNALYVGDNEWDVWAAKKVGCWSVLVERGQRLDIKLDYEIECDYKINTLHELLRLLRHID